ncbi:MAG: hypothetical protein AAB459_02930 [Patescibacteria group bacterium]
MKRLKKIIRRHKKLSLFLVLGIILFASITYYILKPKPIKLTEEQKKNIAKTEQAAFSEVEMANFRELQQIEILIQQSKWDEAKQKLDNYKTIHKKIGNELEFLNTLSYSICIQIADFACLDLVLNSYKELDDKATYTTFTFQVANLAKQKNQIELSKKYFSQLKEVVDALGGENYIKSLAGRDKESGFILTYTMIVEGLR